MRQRSITTYTGYLPKFDEISLEWRRDRGQGAYNWYRQTYINGKKEFKLYMDTERNNKDEIEYTVDLGRGLDYSDHGFGDADTAFVEVFYSPNEAFNVGMDVMEEVDKGGFDTEND